MASIPRWITAPVGQAARAVGRTYDYATPGAGTSTLTNAGRAISDPNQVYMGGVGGLLDKTGDFYKATPVNNGGGSNGVVQGATTNTPGGAYSEDGSAGGADSAYELASLAAQQNQLRDFLNSAGGQLDQGITGINDDVTRLRNKNNQDRGRTLEDFDMKTEDTQRAKDGSLDRIDTNARVQANSLRNMIGRASGSGSSAYQITAPGAVARDASIDRQGVQEDFGTNFRGLTTAKKRADEDYSFADEDITRQGNEKTRALREGVLTAQNDASASLADIERRKAALNGGNPMAAGGAFDADVARRRQAIDSLFGQYRTPIQAKGVTVDSPTLRDYVVDPGEIGGAGQPAGAPAGTSPYSSFLKRRDEDFAF